MGELGRYLTTGREQAGMSLEQLARATRIPEKTLAALEAEWWADLPAPAIARGFVVSVCRTLRIGEAPALDAFVAVRRAAAPREAPPVEAADAVPVEAGGLLVGSRRSGSVNWTYLTIVVVFVIGILVALLTVGTRGGQGDVSRASGGTGLNGSPAVPGAGYRMPVVPGR